MKLGDMPSFRKLLDRPDIQQLMDKHGLRFHEVMEDEEKQPEFEFVMCDWCGTQLPKPEAHYWGRFPLHALCRHRIRERMRQNPNFTYPYGTRRPAGKQARKYQKPTKRNIHMKKNRSVRKWQKGDEYIREQLMEND